MSRLPLAAFLDVPVGGTGAVPDVQQVLRSLQMILGTVVEDVGPERAGDQTRIESARLRALVALADEIRSDPVDGMTLADAAAILALSSPFPPAEVRGRLRDDLLVAMSREPTDLRSLAGRYDLGDPSDLRARIEGEKPLSLREYARLRVAVPPTRKDPPEGPR